MHAPTERKLQQKETHTHTLETEKPGGRRGGTNQRKWEEEKGKRWVKKERSQDVGGRGRGLASNTRRAPGSDLSTPHLPLLVVPLEQRLGRVFCKRLCHN